MSIIVTLLTVAGFKIYILPVLQSIVASAIYESTKGAFSPNKDETYPEVSDSLKEAFIRAYTKVNGFNEAQMQRYLEMDFRIFQKLVYDDIVKLKEMERVKYVDKKLYEAFKKEVKKSKNAKAELTFELIRECKKEQKKSLELITEVKAVVEKTYANTEVLIEGHAEIKDDIQCVGDKVDQLSAMMAQFQSKNSKAETIEFVNRIMPTIKDCIDGLRVKTAYDILVKFEAELDVKCPDEKMLRAKVLYNKASCERFMPNIKSIPTFIKAYELMDEGYDEDIACGYVFAMLVSRNLDAALEAAEKIRAHNQLCTWGWIPDLVKAEDKGSVYNNMPNEVRHAAVLGTLVYLNVDMETIKPLLVDYSYTIPSGIDSVNYYEWILRLRIALDNLLDRWDYNISRVKGRNVATIEIREFYDLSDKYLELVRQTEAVVLMPDVEFLHDYCAFVISSDMRFLEDLNNHQPTSGFREIYTLMKVNIMANLNLEQEALVYIDSLSDITDLILNIRLNIAMERFDVDEIVKSFQLAVDKNIVMKPFRYGYFVSALKTYSEKVCEVAQNIRFENSHDEEVFHLLANLYLGNKIDAKDLKAHEPDVCPMLHCIMADGYKRLGQMQDALSLMRRSVDRTVVDFRTFQYIELLKDWEQGGVELYHFLKELRESGFTANNQWLVDEGNLAGMMSDYEGAKEPFALLVERLPNDNNLLSKYLFILDKLNDAVEIGRLTADILTRKVDPKYVGTIFSVMKNNGHEQRAVEFLYQTIKATDDQQLKGLWFQTSLMSNVRDIITGEKEIIGDGDYVMLNQDGKEVYETIQIGGRLEGLVGKKVGDTLDVKMFNGDEHYEVKTIYTKYYKLLREVMNDASNNRFKEFTSFTIDDLTGGDGNVIDNLERITQSLIGEEFPAYNEQDAIDEYRQGKRPLGAFLNDRELVGGMYEKLYGSFQIYIPQAMPLLQAIEDAKRDLTANTYVLDLSSLLIMEELHRTCGFMITRKFVVPKGLVQLLKDTEKREKQGSLTFLSENVRDALHIDGRMEGETVLGGKVRTLLDWIDNNCEASVAEAKANLVKFANDEKSVYMNVESESLLLALAPTHILLTEDFGLFRPISHVLPMMSCEMWVKAFAPSSISAMNAMLVKCHFIGLHLTAQDIVDLYMSNDKDLTKDLRDTIVYNPCIWMELLEAASMLVNMPNGAQSVAMATHLLTMMFREHDDERAREIYILGIIRYRDDFYKKSLNDALRRTHPILFMNNS